MTELSEKRVAHRCPAALVRQPPVEWKQPGFITKVFEGSGDCHTRKADWHAMTERFLTAPLRLKSAIPLGMAFCIKKDPEGPGKMD